MQNSTAIRSPPSLLRSRTAACRPQQKITNPSSWLALPPRQSNTAQVQTISVSRGVNSDVANSYDRPQIADHYENELEVTPTKGMYELTPTVSRLSLSSAQLQSSPLPRQLLPLTQGGITSRSRDRSRSRSRSRSVSRRASIHSSSRFELESPLSDKRERLGRKLRIRANSLAYESEGASRDTKVGVRNPYPSPPITPDEEKGFGSAPTVVANVTVF